MHAGAPAPLPPAGGGACAQPWLRFPSGERRSSRRHTPSSRRCTSPSRPAPRRQARRPSRLAPGPKLRGRGSGGPHHTLSPFRTKVLWRMRSAAAALGMRTSLRVRRRLVCLKAQPRVSPLLATAVTSCLLNRPGRLGAHSSSTTEQAGVLSEDWQSASDRLLVDFVILGICRTGAPQVPNLGPYASAADQCALCMAARQDCPQVLAKR